jgi:predicted glutamine amidotransferase
MCELMGLSFARPACADFSLRAFSSRGDENADGWGLAWYPDQSLALVKEPVRWQASRFTGFLEKYHGLVSPIYLAHVRHRTVGGPPTHADTQPFHRELRGREYCFGHNGTIAGYAALPLGRFRPVGGADSEHVFCHLLDGLAHRERDLDEPEDWRWLSETLSSLNDGGTLNILLSDGRRLFAYHDRNGHKGLSFHCVNVRSHRGRRFADAELRIKLAGDAANHGFVVASQALGASGWHTFHRGELLVQEAGLVVYSSHRPVTSPEFHRPEAVRRSTKAGGSPALAS